MDSLTQAVLGAALQGTVLGKVQGRRSLLYGAMLATLPDLDVAIRYADPVSKMTFHRGFSHSLFVLTGLALLLTWLTMLVVRRRRPDAGYSGPRVFLAYWLVLVTHPLLDAFTVYGTQLLWPFQPTPQSWAAVFIIDPVYTLPLLAGVIYAVAKGMTGRVRAVLTGLLLFSTAYLGFGLLSKNIAEQRFHSALRAQQIEVTQLRAVPMPFNTLLWRVIAKTPDGHYYEGVSGLFDSEPPEWQRQPLNLDAAKVLQDSPLHERLRWFTGDWLRYDVVGDALVVSDLRMGIPGNYTFRFRMAGCDGEGNWQVQTPGSWPGAGVDSIRNPEALKLILHRIVEQQPPLPLAQWTREYLDGPAPAAGCAG
ncbi:MULTISPECIES: metal-dependent hydrolase [unclassified Pseudomonas]|uniref:metal-dependent hydrolase n=1 Tax=unclassified Pseudomonas TaxID=196821 RepID=UPI0021C94DE6|nr:MULTISPECIES: metal-dependent hydrolase [unclassified Pseudomonas]MCU1734991.1 metal-dependent hydrolase [Pseudomonas sp. 20P_3.2_Bac4]MCU1743466.1 metal-dependent hydrolase [Pseudomonas sp. 20P_3.2_Bac5]